MREEAKWPITANRFVAYFDVMGFKDLVQRNSHETILSKLGSLKAVLKKLENFTAKNNKELAKIQTEKFQTRSATFSDSIVLFSKGESLPDLQKIMADAYAILLRALQDNIGIKGTLSYGTITVNFDESLFFGQPIIDAYLLHEELTMYSVILDDKIEGKLSSMQTTHNFPDSIITTYKTPLKSGRVTHKILKPFNDKIRLNQIEYLTQLYTTVSGKPRIYIDNTIDFLNSLKYQEIED